MASKADCIDAIDKKWDEKIKANKELAEICDIGLFGLCIKSHFDQGIFNESKDHADEWRKEALKECQ